MRRALSVATSLLVWIAAAHTSRADSTWELSVQVKATVQAAPPQITLSWPQDTFSLPNSYTVYRKAPGASAWGSPTVLPGTATSYVDRNVSVGTAYEYQVIKQAAQYSGSGYLLAGIQVPAVETRGKVVLVVDKTYASQLAGELARLEQDLTGDGWSVVRVDVARTDTPANVRNLIRAQYQADPANVRSVFLFGRVPVPYSGNIVPDGHTPEHQGAWPADAYYGDMDGSWTDSTVNTVSASDARNRNVPGDGKFDQSTLPSNIELMVGRVDLANMPGRLSWGGTPTFPNELELLRNYLNKHHKFRHKAFDLPRRGVVGDYFGFRNGEAFAASGWRNFAPFFGAENVTTLPDKGTWIPTLKGNAFLWAYGCGAGSYTSIGGLGNTGPYNDGVTPELYQADAKAVFTMLFGSWLGDWDSEDNIQRAVLALPSYGLACAWSGRPHWFLHHMALGETIGFAARLTQNNGTGLYQNQVNNCASQIHVALMGDPTLRMHMVAPPTNLRQSATGSGVALSWTGSAEPVLGYLVYRAPNAKGPFTRITPAPISATAFTDAAPTGATNYMVRAVKLETSASGTYYNLSQGAFFGSPGTATDGTSTTGGNTTVSNNTTVGGTTTGGNTTTNSTTPTPTGTVGMTDVSWVDDSLPAGARPGADGGDAWTWVSNPAPFRGSVGHQTASGTGTRQHYFSAATARLPISTGDVLFAYVYLDPANPPREVMLQWNNGDWEHRAYWGANLINSGADGTSNRRYMGPLPAVGKWVRLEVPASQVALEGSTLNGMAFTIVDGKASWDFAGKATLSASGSTGGNSTPGTSDSLSWVDDALPAGAVPGADGGDAWTWVSSNPAPFRGTRAHQSSLSAGLHQHYFSLASDALQISTGDSLFAYVYLDPANPPKEIMLQWNDGDWDHRAYWGANLINYGADGTPTRRYVGPLPAAGTWARLEVPASKVALEGMTVKGMAFTVFDGRATWDYAGKSGLASGTSGGTTNPTPNVVTNTTPASTGFNWVDDTLPAGAVAGAEGGDAWIWGSSNPAPVSGSAMHRSAQAGGFHQHYFTFARSKLTVNTGDVLFAHIYLDPASLPTQIMLQWYAGSWEHRAYWGTSRILNGVEGTASRRKIGGIPEAGKWVKLEVPASMVGLEGKTVDGMAFSLMDGTAAWDSAGTRPAGTSGSGTSTNSTPNTGTSTNSTPGGGTPATGGSTNLMPGVSVIDYLNLEIPAIGDNTLHVLTPTVLELKLINTRPQGAATVTQWDLVDANSQFRAPPLSAFAVTANGKSIGVSSVGFKRRPLYAPIAKYDLRIENSLYLQLSTPVSDNELVEVKNPDGTLWSAATSFSTTAEPLRYSPALHVNQEGYMPNYPKKAMVGYYLGNLGELSINSGAGFRLVNTATGATAFQGTLTARPDSGYPYTPTPYQKVYEADFTAFNTPGEYQLVVPGMGASLPFLINSGVAMSFARTYALGLYHQRCGTSTTMPHTRFTHDKCHTAPASIPMPADQFAFTWTTVAGYANTINQNNPPQTAPALTSAAAQLFPMVKQGSTDVSGGHHDAGDYSKYTINSASMIHYLMFAVDSLDGVAALDNLGIPESGDGISDVLQEAKWEADFLAKMQDVDGGFYFLVYPRNREYEAEAIPEKGDAQVVWPKTTSVTAASVAALAQCASSPRFKQAYPAAAAQYLQKAQLGWQFLMNAISTRGKNGAYQKITHYGDDFADNDELVWAASEMYLATGDPAIHTRLMSWFDPANPATWRWGWWHLSQCWGHAIRSYAFAARSGRLSGSQLDTTFLNKCNAQVAAAGDDTVTWSRQNAYGSSFPENTKRVLAAGWYFSTDMAFDTAVAYQLNPKSEYMQVMLANMNYEAGCNPVNVSYVTGLGWKRQRDVVSQWAVNDTRVLPPSGQPVGNITANLGYLWNYGGILDAVCFPNNNAATAPYSFYDRWSDSWNVNAEFVVLNQARSLGTLAFLAAQTPLKTQAWKPVAGTIQVPSGIAPVGKPVTVSLQAPGIDLSDARIVWEARDQEPAFGPTFTFSPKNNGAQWVEAEAQLPDGRRVFAKATFNANAPDIVWVDDALPTGATGGGDGGDTWNWVSSSPTPRSGAKAHQSAVATGTHQHYFDNASATLTLEAGDTLYAWVYLDPANPPSEIMLQWTDGSWDHRAYWGANQIDYGADGTVSRRYMGPLPAAGQWVQLKVPASQVGLEGRTVKGMAFTLYGGRATWDAAGRLSSAFTGTPASVPVYLARSGQGFQLSWASTSNASYRVSYKNALDATDWNSASNLVVAKGDITTWTDATVSAQRYYMVLREP